ncbi:uncharacterized protein At2g39920-like [Chenopodium quinoa]|uniref:uncharacterized protein At2g39920-like n=1 Tax=Chenopodium quinoa TaxID=63459 RepID=UPI000B7976B8|nr:uncharacterized protein At2g39920-like [Chenopodium quinoa]
MSSFAATVFIAGFITIGILLITSLVTLIVMLQSCQSQSSGILESQKSFHNEDYCKYYALYYTREGQFVRDLNFSISMAEKYFSSIIRPYNHDFNVVLMDIDDILPSSVHYSKLLKDSCRDCNEEEINLRRMLMLSLYNRIQESGWTLMLITRTAQKHQIAITKYLVSAGYIGWTSLITRSTDEMMLSSLEYFSRRIAAIERQGNHIVAVISSSLDILAGFSIGKPIFKLPKIKLQKKECSKQQLKLPTNNSKTS